MKDYILIKKSTFRLCVAILLLALLGVGGWLCLPYVFPPYFPPKVKNETLELRADGRHVMWLKRLPDKELRQLVKEEREHLSLLLDRLDHTYSELDYYLSVHDVQDEGFDMVAAYSAFISNKSDETKSLIASLDSAIYSTRLHVVRTTSFQRIDTIKMHPIFTEMSGGVWLYGHWLPKAKQGKGVALDHSGRLLAGRWVADTLQTGIRLDSIGIYWGEFNSMLVPNGHGSLRYFGGQYYEGNWTDDRRDGFGFMADSTGLKAGEWKNDSYKGERMSYTIERIYGIDISKYQHLRGKRATSINWDRLRITDLGHINNKNVVGQTDYPISFVYIKSTEGKNIINPYYKADSRQARRHGIIQGAYHFFSTISSGKEQARHFLRNSKFSPGDLPPVLDVEPSDKQITQMGGHEALFQNIREWLETVENETGTTPILYLNQRFVDKYFSKEPDLMEHHKVWMARYSEYKPGVRLVIWQLSPDGKVSGIKGDVDINVFNGYKVQWEQFTENNCIR